MKNATTASSNAQKKALHMAMNRRNVDMFSYLPESLIIIIAGFLSFKEAARTCVLSKQWRHIWRNAMNINLNENFFVKLDEPEENQNIQRATFINFAQQFIVNHSTPVIKTLELSCSKPKDFLVDMQNIVMFAASHKVRELGLDFSDPSWRDEAIGDLETVFELPSLVYQNGDLESLKLFSCTFDASKFTSFSALKSLSIGWIRLSMSSIMAVLKSCPLLESLSLKKCWCIDHFEFSIPNSGLKSLVLDHCDFNHDWLLIEGPKFHSFKYSGNVAQFHMDNQREMVEAELDFAMQAEFEEIGEFLYDLLQQLFSVQVLTVCSVLLQIVPNGEEPLGLQAPLQVRDLTLKTAMHDNEICGIKFMLRSCPLLETLTIDIGPATIFPDYEPPYEILRSEFWTNNLVMEKCVARTLKVVNVKGFKGTVNELYVLQYFVCFGGELEELNLHVYKEDGDSGENREFVMARADQLASQCIIASQNLIISVFYR